MRLICRPTALRSAILTIWQKEGGYTRWANSPEGDSVSLLSCPIFPCWSSLAGEASDDGASGKEAPMIIMSPASDDQRFP